MFSPKIWLHQYPFNLDVMYTLNYSVISKIDYVCSFSTFVLLSVWTDRTAELWNHVTSYPIFPPGATVSQSSCVVAAGNNCSHSKKELAWFYWWQIWRMGSNRIHDKSILVYFWHGADCTRCEVNPIHFPKKGWRWVVKKMNIFNKLQSTECLHAGTA